MLIHPTFCSRTAGGYTTSGLLTISCSLKYFYLFKLIWNVLKVHWKRTHLVWRFIVLIIFLFLSLRFHLLSSANSVTKCFFSSFIFRYIFYFSLCFFVVLFMYVSFLLCYFNFELLFLCPPLSFGFLFFCFSLSFSFLSFPLPLLIQLKFVLTTCFSRGR